MLKSHGITNIIIKIKRMILRMASKVTKKSNIAIQGILDITDDGAMMVSVEDIETPFVLSELFEEYKGKDVKITIAYGEDID